jgi:hypothetical protein
MHLICTWSFEVTINPDGFALTAATNIASANGIALVAAILGIAPFVEVII